MNDNTSSSDNWRENKNSPSDTFISPNGVPDTFSQEKGVIATWKNGSPKERIPIILKFGLPLLICILSFFVFAKFATNIDYYSETVRILDNSKKDVLELMGGSTAASAALTVLPGDIATPIAEQLANISSYFLIVLAALYSERFLLTVIGFAAFKIFIPSACILFVINIFLKKEVLTYLSRRLFVFGLAIFLIIPTSTKISGMINESYGTTIAEITKEAKEATQEVESQSQNSSASDDQGWFDSLISSAKEKITGSVKKMENVLNRLLEALAVLIVTSCVIPIMVIIIFAWLIKTIFRLDFSIKPPANFPKRKM